MATQSLTGVLSVTNANKGSIIPDLITKSLHSGPSPVILPKAQTACSHTFTWGDDKSCIKIGTAPNKWDDIY